MTRPKKPRTPSARAARREAERRTAHVHKLRERLFLTEPGSSAARPLRVESASVIEPHARSMPCPRCEGPLQVQEHRAQVAGGHRLREVRVRCRQCGSERSLWFELEQMN